MRGQREIKKHIETIERIPKNLQNSLEIRLQGINESRMKRFFFNQPVRKLIILVILNLILFNVVKYFSSDVPIRTIIEIVNVVIAVYFVLAVVYIVRRRIDYLMNPDHIIKLIAAYAFLVVLVLLIFSTVLSVVESANLGYITYGQCGDRFDYRSVINDGRLSHDYFYFTAISFFSVSYGDICPMGFAKYWAILTAFCGHIVSVILVAIIINNYMRARERKKE